MIARKLLTTLVAAALLALAACGDDEGRVEESGTGTTATGTGTSTTPAKSGPVVARVKVRETEFALDPRNPKISKAGVVQFDVTNAGQAPHALEVEGPTGEVETETIEPGGKATLRADLSKAGRYVWYCPVGDHEKRGMTGRITVAGAGSGSSRDDPASTSADDPGKGSDDSGKGRDDADRGEDAGGVSGGGY